MSFQPCISAVDIFLPVHCDYSKALLLSTCPAMLGHTVCDVLTNHDHLRSPRKKQKHDCNCCFCNTAPVSWSCPWHTKKCFTASMSSVTPECMTASTFSCQSNAIPAKHFSRRTVVMLDKTICEVSTHYDHLRSPRKHKKQIMTATAGSAITISQSQSADSYKRHEINVYRVSKYVLELMYSLCNTILCRNTNART